MESEEQPRASCSLLVPGWGCLDMDEDDSEVVIGIRPKSSPLPRRKSSLSEEDSEPDSPPPLSGSRRVSFADAKGLSLVQVKEFDLWDVPQPPGFQSQEDDKAVSEDYILCPLTFHSPLSPEDLLVRVQEQKIELESLELIPGTSTLKGVVRVLNVSYHKAVYVRTTLDCWASHFDLLTEYLPAPNDDDAHTDRFAFKFTLIPPFQEQGSRVDFCLRYETPVGTFWANNSNRNYVLLCHQRVTQKENTQKKSCLKTICQNFVENSSETPSQETLLADGATDGEKAEEVKAIPLPDSRTEEGRKNLQAENRNNCSRRNRRKAARMARVKDYFSQRDSGDVSPPEDKTATKDAILPGNPEDAHKDNVKLEDTFGDEAAIEHNTQEEDSGATVAVCGTSLPGTGNEEPRHRLTCGNAMAPLYQQMFDNSDWKLSEKTTPSTKEKDSSTEREEFPNNTIDDSTQESFDTTVKVPFLVKDTWNDPEVIEHDDQISINIRDVFVDLPTVKDASGETQKDIPRLSPSQLDHGHEDQQMGLKQSEEAKASNHLEVTHYAKEHENIFAFCAVGTPCPEEPREAVHDFLDDKAGGKHVEPSTILEDKPGVLDVAKCPKEETIICAENIEVQNWEMMVEEEEVNVFGGEDRRSGEQKHDQLIVETKAFTSTEAEVLVPLQNQITTGGEEPVESVVWEYNKSVSKEFIAKNLEKTTLDSQQDVSEMRESKMVVEKLEGVDDEDGVDTEEQEKDLHHPELVDVAKGKQDEVQMLEFNHNMLEDSLLNHLQDKDVAREDLKEVQMLEFDHNMLEHSFMNHLQDKDVSREDRKEVQMLEWDHSRLEDAHLNQLQENDGSRKYINEVQMLEFDPNRLEDALLNRLEEDDGSRKDPREELKKAQMLEFDNNKLEDTLLKHLEEDGGSSEDLNEVQLLKFDHNKLKDTLLNYLQEDDGSREDSRKELNEVQMLEFDHSKLEDTLLNHLQEDDGSREDLNEVQMLECDLNRLEDALLNRLEEDGGSRKDPREELNEVQMLEFDNNKLEDTLLNHLQEDGGSSEDLNKVQLLKFDYNKLKDTLLNYLQEDDGSREDSREELNEVQMLEFDHSKLEDTLLNHLQEDDRSREDLNEVQMLECDLNRLENALLNRVGEDDGFRKDPREELNEVQVLEFDNNKLEDTLLDHLQEDDGSSEDLKEVQMLKFDHNKLKDTLLNYLREDHASREDSREELNEAQMSEFDHSKLEDTLLNHLQEDDGSREDLKEVHISEFDHGKYEGALLNHLQKDYETREDPSEEPTARTLDESDGQDDGKKTVTLNGQDLNEGPENDHTSDDSDSDDEVELYMHCLRAVHASHRSAKDQSVDAAFNPSKRPSLSSSKPLSAPMPSISEAADEEHLCCEDAQTTDVHAKPQAGGAPSTIRKASWWRETSCRCMSKTMLFAALLAVFVVTAYYYDFLACFGLYLISVVWLLCQEEKQPMKDNTMG
ncbi:uncharacterized protein LOC133549311 [Nerophis ophidion]|uniref:uncharacterized protein LOC133549311 n=1 Tax=Nerophis ophidion TaxID=159077 RepID=UPI002ADFFC57|nr:uncharacterized protein LOC133549311 [Nerophis ophidion]